MHTKAEFVDSQSAFVGQILNLLYVLLALSVIVSLFGMVNTLVLSVFERTRELGMLRAVGMTRRQVRRLVRHESVITALIGAGLGLPLGVLLGWAVTHSLDRYGVEFALPVGSLVAFTLVAVAAGILAAVLPARRAARLDVLRRSSTSKAWNHGPHEPPPSPGGRFGRGADPGPWLTSGGGVAPGSGLGRDRVRLQCQTIACR